ncbi:hypothetical protein C7U61_04665 [Rhizobium sp. JAB6]|jgi:hypothetical protein|uniref:hypothetical protein n=1 Tax=Rhizobium sp. JAB6 TaxID=2127050 RepID=UPI000D1367D1|nr:hypothetical protein [Rhizobium sp. JAB6]PST22571.1 hypothetical protein C7U61_04665 [Rhizobium sp. JAB6]
MSSVEDAPAGATPIESSKPAIVWGPIIGGALAATGTALILLLLGSGVGLTMVSPWSGQSSSAATLGITAAIWLVVVQWLSSAIGGYLTGRLRTKWVEVHSDEVFFRDTAHGFLSWALATVFVAGFLASSLTSLAGTTVNATTQVAKTAASAAASAGQAGDQDSTAYFTDALLRPAKAATSAQSDDRAAAAKEITAILLQGAATGQISDADKSYVATVVSARTGLSEADARNRVDSVLKQIDDAKTAAKAAADKARKTAATTALIGSLSLLVGAFIASAAAALAGRQRDEEEDFTVGAARTRR